MRKQIFRRGIPISMLPPGEFIRHLRRHPIPELISPDCLEALGEIERAYGDRWASGGGLEIRLGEEAPLADYSLFLEDHTVPNVEEMWYELDYEEFRAAHETGRKITPCRFIEVHELNYDTLRKETLPVFWGEDRCQKLLPQLDLLFRHLNPLTGAHFRYMGVMDSRGEDALSRLVIYFPTWDDAYHGLESMGWPGNVEKFRRETEAWQVHSDAIVDVDLSETGLLPKIGFDIITSWKNYVLIGKFIAMLQERGLCLPSKAAGLGRWARILPADGDPVLLTKLLYVKLNYKEGRIAEAKAYLSQSAN